MPRCNGYAPLRRVGLLLRRRTGRFPGNKFQAAVALGPDAVEADFNGQILAFDGHIEVAEPGYDGNAPEGAYRHIAAPHDAIFDGSGFHRIDVARLVVHDRRRMDINEIVAKEPLQRAETLSPRARVARLFPPPPPRGGARPAAALRPHRTRARRQNCESEKQTRKLFHDSSLYGSLLEKTGVQPPISD